MDNLCHTLAGLALAEAGLKRRTARATVALVIGANLPDVDVLSYAWSPVTALAFRRGWTHGVLALALWPFVLTALLLAWDRWRRRPDRTPADPRALLLVSAIGILSHPFLDWMNVYGMRWLMPFSDRWFYGDTLFIVDVWIWLVLAAGVVLARVMARQAAGRAGEADDPARLTGEHVARIALGLVAAYIVVMAGSSLESRLAVRRAFAAQGQRVEALMVAPLPLTPLRREFVARIGDTYQRGWVVRRRVTFEGDAVHRMGDTPAALAAAQTADGRRFLAWARFPLFVQGPSDTCPLTHVCLRDARYLGQAWAEVAIPGARPLSLAPPFTSPEYP